MVFSSSSRSRSHKLALEFVVITLGRVSGRRGGASLVMRVRPERRARPVVHRSEHQNSSLTSLHRKALFF